MSDGKVHADELLSGSVSPKHKQKINIELMSAHLPAYDTTLPPPPFWGGGKGGGTTSLHPLVVGR